MKTCLFLWFVLIVNTCTHPEGFSSDTLIHTPNGLILAQNLHRTDVITSPVLHDATSTSSIGCVITYQTQSAVLITTKSDTLLVASDQRFYLPLKQCWCKAAELSTEDSLISIDGSLISITALEYLNDPINLISLSVTQPHILAIGHDGIIAHNAAPVLVCALCPALYGAGSAAGTTALVTAIGYTSTALAASYAFWQTCGHAIKTWCAHHFSRRKPDIICNPSPIIPRQPLATCGSTVHELMPNIYISCGSAEANDRPEPLSTCAPIKAEQPSATCGLVMPEGTIVSCGTGQAQYDSEVDELIKLSPSLEEGTAALSSGNPLIFKKSKGPRNSLGGRPKPNPEDRYKLPKIKKSEELFGLPFGKRLIGKCEKIPTKDPYLESIGAQLHRMKHDLDPYLKENDFFYVDTLHWDHIEVFNKQGRAKNVLNLDGSKNESKSDRSIDEKRTIRV